MSAPTLLMYIFTFIIGLFTGSFLKLLSDRLNRGETVVKGRSHCESCSHPLLILDLIPLFSYIFLKGRCRYCSARLSFHYPLSEFLTGVAFVSAAYYSGVFKEFSYFLIIFFVYLIAILSMYIVILFSDMSFQIIPDKVVLPGIVVSFLFMGGIQVYSLITLKAQLLNHALGKYLLEAGYFDNQIKNSLQSFALVVVSSLLLFAFFWLLIFITKGRGMGGGDMKLALMIGLFNGFPGNVFAIFIAFLTGACYGITLILLKRTTLKGAIAFGPFMIFGSLVALFGKEFIVKVLSL